MKKLIILAILSMLTLTSCISAGIGIDSRGLRGNIGVRTGGLINGRVNLDTRDGLSGGVGIGF